MSKDDDTAASDVPAAATGAVARRDRFTLWLVLLGYIAVVVYAAMHHEMWRDEVRALSLARDGSLADLFGQLRYEGHPAMWFLLLRTGYLLTGSRLVLPILSLAVATATVYLVLRYAPFPWWQKVLLVMGVFPLYEYSVVARNYGIGVLLIVVLAIVYPQRLQRPVWWGVLLAVLANTSVHAAIVAAAILVGTGWDFIAAWRTGAISRQSSVRPRQVWIGAAIAIAGLIAARATVSTTKLPDEPGGMPRARTVAHQMALSAVNPGRFLGLLIPSPAAQLDDRRGGKPASVVQAAAIDLVLVAFVVALWGEWSLLLIVVAAVSASGALFRLVYGPNIRHLGPLWFLLVLVCWQLARSRTVQDHPTPTRGQRRWWSLMAAVTVVMALQAIEGVRRVRQDVRESWSSGQALGALLHQPEYRNAIVASTNDFWLETVPYYADNRLYFHNQHRFETYVHLAMPFYGRHSVQVLFNAIDSMAPRPPAAPVLLLVSDDDMARATETESALLRARTSEVAALNRVIGDESYHVLLLTSAGPGSGPPPH